MLFRLKKKKFSVLIAFFETDCARSGYVWSNAKNMHPFWEVTMVFRVSGRGRIGADGLVSIHRISVVSIISFSQTSELCFSLLSS